LQKQRKVIKKCNNSISFAQIFSGVHIRRSRMDAQCFLRLQRLADNQKKINFALDFKECLMKKFPPAGYLHRQDTHLMGFLKTGPANRRTYIWIIFFSPSM
jgi:hypothetical protein